MTDQKKHGIIISTNFLLSILILLASSFSAYVINSLSDQIKEQQKEINELGCLIHNTHEKLVSHLGWHNGKEGKL